MGRKLQDLTDQHFGLWTVVGPHEIRNRCTYWFCRCKCGTEKWVTAGHLKYGKSEKCRVCGKTENLTGQRFGLWKVVGPSVRRERLYWLCQCGCGTQKWVRAANLKSGKSRSCGKMPCREKAMERD